MSDDEGAIGWELGSCMFTGLDEDGFPVAQFDAQGADPRVSPVELHHPFGFASRPRDPEVDNDGQVLEGKACNMWFATEGNTMHAMLGFDPRFVTTFPKLEKGGSMMYCAPGSFVNMDGDDGTHTTYVPVPGDKAHIITTGVDGNKKPFIGIEHANGMAVTMLENSLVIKNKDGSAYVEVNDSGVTINGNTVINGGATIGSPAGTTSAVMWEMLQVWATQLEAAIVSAFGAVGVSVSAAGPAGAAAFSAQMAPLASAFLAAKAQFTKVA